MNVNVSENNVIYDETITVEQTINEKIKNKKQIRKIIYAGIKRIFDIIIGLIGCIALIPITIIVYILNKINKENGPIFYEQLRIGKNGKYFRIFKFRSMVISADKILNEYLEENSEAKKEWEDNRKLDKDPRITKTGKFLRETSLDELPQVLNLLNSTMSLIGPRPVVDGEIDNYGENKEKFLSVKPGITGYWQVNGRSNTNYKDRMEMELYYVDNQSLWLDIKIFFKTFISVIKKEGAM